MSENPSIPTPEPASAAPAETVAPPESPARVISLWAAIGCGLLLLLAAIAVAARIPTLADALDLSRVFR